MQLALKAVWRSCSVSVWAFVFLFALLKELNWGCSYVVGVSRLKCVCVFSFFFLSSLDVYDMFWRWMLETSCYDRLAATVALWEV